MTLGSTDRTNLLITILLVIVSMFLSVVDAVPKGEESSINDVTVLGWGEGINDY
jgi:hypothetical protein